MTLPGALKATQISGGGGGSSLQGYTGSLSPSTHSGTEAHYIGSLGTSGAIISATLEWEAQNIPSSFTGVFVVAASAEAAVAACTHPEYGYLVLPGFAGGQAAAGFEWSSMQMKRFVAIAGGNPIGGDLYMVVSNGTEADLSYRVVIGEVSLPAIVQPS